MRRIVHADDWVTLSYDDTLGLARYERSATPYPSLADLERSQDALVGAVERASVKSARLLVDLRRAPPRNDEGFESLAARTIQRLAPHVAAVAWLVKTAAGKLQIARLTGQNGIVFDDEEAALAFLRRPKR